MSSSNRGLFGDELENGELPPGNEPSEERRRKLMYELNTSGKYFAFKEQLKVGTANMSHLRAFFGFVEYVNMHVWRIG